MQEEHLSTAGGRITCRRCNAMSKRTRLQCGAPAIRGKSKCRSHGGLSTGPRTAEGLARCAQVKTIHGHETREKRERSKEVMAQIRLYAAILGLSTRSSSIRWSNQNKH